MRVPSFEPVGQFSDRPLLVAGEREVGYEIEAIVDRRHLNRRSYHGSSLRNGGP